MLLTRILLWIFWLGLGVGRFVLLFVGVGRLFFGSFWFPLVHFLFGTSWFFCSIYYFFIDKKKKNPIEHIFLMKVILIFKILILIYKFINNIK